MGDESLSPHQKRNRPPSEDAPAMKYPSWRYKAGSAPRLIQSPAEDASLGSGWSDSPDPHALSAEDRAIDAQLAEEAIDTAPLKFPSWRYHRNGDSRLVQSIDEARALGADWADSPEFPPMDAQTEEILTGSSQQDKDDAAKRDDDAKKNKAKK